MKTILFLFCVISYTLAKSINYNDCEISIEYKNGDLQEPQPLILTNTKKPTFVLPVKKNILSIPKNSSIILACPGKNNGLVNFDNSKSIKATCLMEKKFIVESSVHDFNTFKCKTQAKEYVKKTNNTCLQNHLSYEIGFQVGKNFITVLEICRDESNLRSYYSKMTMPKEIYSFQSKFPRPYWKYAAFYPGHNMTQYYKADSQVRSVGLSLGSKELAQEYIKNGKQYLNRGHLAAKADFIYGSIQSATFWLLNTAPQWASFNAGNWVSLENDVRNFASTREMDLTVYTGVHGITTLTDINGNEQPLYLHVNETDKAIPVPRFYWKIIHDPISNRATAFVGLNEPYAKNITKDMYLCTDIGKDSTFSWLTWKADNIERGVSYVCSVKELRKAVPTIPQLGEVSLLV